jgi:hypothetical protein
MAVYCHGYVRSFKVLSPCHRTYHYPPNSLARTHARALKTIGLLSAGMVRWAVSCARFGCFGATERMPSAFSSSSVPPLPSTDDRTLPGCGTDANVRKGATIPTRRHQQNCGQVYTQAPAALSLCCRPARVRHCACWTPLPTLSGITLTYTHVFPRRCVLPALCVRPSACNLGRSRHTHLPLWQ